jgi:hypothetical protein
MSEMVRVDLPALMRALGDSAPEVYGVAFARSFCRAQRGDKLSIANLDRMAVKLGVHYSYLLADEDEL